MANVHVDSIDGTDVTVVMHFTVPNTNNAAGVNWRTIAARKHGTTSLPDGDGTAGTISAAEKTQIQSGQVVEQVRTIKLGDNNPTGPQIDAEHTAQRAVWLADFQARYNRYGFTR
jgi:hypothetical protein